MIKDYATFVAEARAAHEAEGFDADQLEPHLAEWYEAYLLDELDKAERKAEAARKDAPADEDWDDDGAEAEADARWHAQCDAEFEDFCRYPEEY